MAKFAIAAFALIAMVGSVAADPVLDLLGGGQGQGVGGLTNTLGGGLLSQLTERVLATVHSVTQTTANRVIERESPKALQVSTEAAYQAVIQAHARGATPEAAQIAAHSAVQTVIAPLVEILATETSVAAVNAVYYPQAQGHTQAHTRLGRK